MIKFYAEIVCAQDYDRSTQALFKDNKIYKYRQSYIFAEKNKHGRPDRDRGKEKKKRKNNVRREREKRELLIT